MEFDLMRSAVEYGEARAAEAGKNVSFALTTNGTLMTEDMARFLAEHKIMYLLSIDGCRATHDANRKLLGGGSSWDEVMARLPLMKRFQPWLGSRITTHPSTVGTLREDVELLFGRGINQFIIGPASGVAWPEEALCEYERQMLQVTDYYKSMQAKRAPFRMTLYEKDIEIADAGKGLWGCGAGRGRICISVTGDIYPCAKVVGMDALRDTYRLRDIWEGVTNLRLRRDFLNTHPAVRPRCIACECADDCSGGCPAVNLDATGSVFEPAPLECRFTEIFVRIKRYYHGG